MPESPLHFSVLDPVLAGLGSSGRWLVAYSGGRDSSVLLHLMGAWRRAHGGESAELVAVHVNHGLQPDGEAWRAHCQRTCEAWSIPLIAIDAQVIPDGRGVEAAAREARYDVFEQLLEKGDSLFMAHHLDDQVETFFLRLLRGAGLGGLAAMPAQRSLGAGQLLRPLLAVPRSHIDQYLVEHQLRAIDDPSNNDTELDRNYLRHRLLPLLEERWPAYRQTVSRAATHAAVGQAVINDNVPVPATIFSVMGDPGLALAALLDVSLPTAMVMLRRWLGRARLDMPDQAALKEFVRQLREGGASGNARLQCRQYVLQRYQGGVFLLPQSAGARGSTAMTLAAGESLELPDGGRVSLQPSSDGVGFRLAEGDRLRLGWRRGGETARVQGRPYNQRLKKLLQEFAVPPWWRERVPLLYDGAELIAVGDLWLCESSRLATRGNPGETLWQLRWQRKPFAFD